MSFDVFLSRFKNGEPDEVPRQPVRDVLNARNYRGPDQFGFYVITFSDGIHVEFSAAGLESEEDFTDCAFHIRGIGDDLIKFIFEVARAGNMVTMPAMEGNPLILLSEGQMTDVPPEAIECLRPVIISTPDEMKTILIGGIEGWLRYRDQVLSQTTREKS